jgi:cytochrome P450
LHSYPYDFYDEIRASPVVGGRFAAVTARHEVVSRIARDPAFRSGFPDEILPAPVRAVLSWAQDPAVVNGGDRPSMLVSNGVEHERYRRLATHAFTARAVAGLAGRVEEFATELLDGMGIRTREEDTGDLVEEYAQLLPVRVLAEILGVPPQMRETFLRWARPIVPLTDFGLGYRKFLHAEAALRELNEWFVGHFEHLRHHPGEDLLSSIITATRETNHDPDVDDVGLLANASLMLLAGFETTVNLLGNGAVLLMAHPDQLSRLRADPTGWTNAVDEILRFDSPVQSTWRYVAQATQVHGVALRRGALIILMTGGANRDPAAFEHPDTFDVTRRNAREHLSFSLGAHFCVGAALARLEGEIGLRLLFDRFPALSLAGEPRRRPTRVARGYDRIPVRLGGPAGNVARAAAQHRGST